MNLTRAEFLKGIGLSVAGIALAPSLSPMLYGEGTVANPMGELEVNPHFVNCGPGFGRRVALTFDDGPTPGITEKVLDELSKRNIRATFFMIGKRVEACPELARRVLAEGHEVGNHTYTHPALKKMPEDKVNWELQKCQDIISSTINQTPVWFRPPYGSFDRKQGPMAMSRGLGVAYWSVDPMDWKKPGSDKIAASVLNGARPGSIILMHDLHKQTADAVPEIFDGLMERDFEFTTLSGFLGAPYDTATV